MLSFRYSPELSVRPGLAHGLGVGLSVGFVPGIRLGIGLGLSWSWTSVTPMARSL